MQTNALNRKNTTGNAGLFIPGPTNVPDQVRMAMNVSMQDMRASDFGDLTLPIFADMKKMFKTETGSVFMFPGSGTAGWEACIANLFSEDERVLMSSFGQFSSLWVDMANRWRLQVENVDVEWGKGVPLDEYRRILEKDHWHTIKAVFVCHNETATGVTSDLKAVRQILDDLNHPALLCVDAVSSFASMPLEMDAWGLDVVVAGSQKGLMLPAGLGIVAVSERALESRKTATLPNTFLSFDDQLKFNGIGQFPYTPATQLLHGLRASIDFLNHEGLDNVFARHTRLANAVREGVRGWGLELCAKSSELYSDTVSTIMVPSDVDGDAVLKTAYFKYNVSFGGGLAKLKGKAFRIGHIGNLNEIMVFQALAAAEASMVECGASIELGSGVAAAQAYIIKENQAVSAPDLKVVA